MQRYSISVRKSLTVLQVCRNIFREMLLRGFDNSRGGYHSPVACQQTLPGYHQEMPHILHKLIHGVCGLHPRDSHHLNGG